MARLSHKRREPSQASMSSVGDFRTEGMLCVATVRSPVARGSVRSIVFPKLPAGYRSILPADIPGRNRIVSFGAEVPILAQDAVSYIGEPVALIAGPDPILLEELVANTKVFCEAEEPFVKWESFSSEQVAAKRVAVSGDPDLAFSIASSVHEATYTSGAIEHYYSEPQGAAAAYDYDKIAVWCATQWPYHVRDSVALALGCRAQEVSVRPTRLGIHLDGKLWYPSLLACQAAVASIACGRPAKILLTREEDFRYSPKRARSSVSVRSALGPSGELSALDLRIAVNVGAYGPLADEILSQAVLASSGAYACPNLRIEGYAVVTNTPPMGAFGGLGASHSLFAVEAQANRMALIAGEDPADWKSRNVLRKGSLLLTGEPMREEAPYEALLARVSAASDYRRKYAGYELVRKRRSGRSDGPLRGIGLSFAYQGAGPFLSGEASNSYTVEATLSKDLGVSILTSAAGGAGRVTEVWRRSAADVLGVGIEKVSVAPPDTDQVPDSGPSTLSRNVSVVNRLVERACEAIQKRRFREPLPLTARSIYRMPKPIKWEGGQVSGSPFDTAAWACAVVELELDAWTLEPRPLGVWLCVEGGTVVAPDRAASALRSGVADALGACMVERFDPSSDADESAYFRYGLLPLQRLPPISIEFLEPPSRAPVKGIGELPFDTVPAAFLSALSQAADSPFSSLPVPAADILRSLEST
jgi:CO/xanthine dehydrogenase Mo-binding subunit